MAAGKWKLEGEYETGAAQSSDAERARRKALTRASRSGDRIFTKAVDVGDGTTELWIYRIPTRRGTPT